MGGWKMSLADDADTSSAGLALFVRGLGEIAYPSAERDWFVGVSGTLSVTDTDDGDQGLGYGATLQLGAATLGESPPRFTAATVYQEGKDAFAVAVGVDLWCFLASPDVSALRNMFAQ